MGRQYRHLTLAEREDIMVHWKNRVGVSEIARLVGRDKSTVSREIRRNGWYSPVAGRMWCYRASTAHDKSQRRARRCRRQPLLADPRRLELVARLIRDRHRPPRVRIEGRIMIERPDLGVSDTTILQGGPQRPAGPHSRRAQEDERPIAPQEAPQEGPSRRAGQDHDHPRAGRAARHRRPARTGGRGGGRHRRGPYERRCTGHPGAAGPPGGAWWAARPPPNARSTSHCSIEQALAPHTVHTLTVDRGHEFAPGSRPSRTTGRPRPLLPGPLPLAARHQ